MYSIINIELCWNVFFNYHDATWTLPQLHGITLVLRLLITATVYDLEVLYGMLIDLIYGLDKDESWRKIIVNCVI